MTRTRNRQVRKVEAGSAVDPRHGDIEDDASSTKRYSMLSLAGNMLVEISWPKLIVAWTLLLIIPGLLLGLAPLIAQEWLATVSNKIAHLIGIWSLLLLVAVIALGWFGWRALFRLVEASFWALNSIVVQPGYAMIREGLRHIVEKVFAKNANENVRANLRAASAAVAGIIVFAVSLLVIRWVWPYADFFGSLSELKSWRHVAVLALANSVVAITAYLGIAALIWGFADALMAQPRSLATFQAAPRAGRKWRIVHLSDIHVVGDRYGFRLESGRWGPRGNERLKRLFKQLEAIDKKDKIDVIMITGDMTDAGISTEWAALYDILADHPRLADRVLMLPGNHDLNIVDRANPARLDLPTSPNRRLRQIRCLAAMDAIQGKRVRVIDRDKDCVGKTLAEALRPYRKALARFADVARPLLSYAIPDLWARSFPQILPPDKPGGLGIILLDSNADAHFSFTNALGLVTAEQMHGLKTACEAYPDACWIIGLHHHVMEYPWAVKAFSERIGTALINGNWFIRSLKPLTDRAILMHGHRHIDWIGEIAKLPVVSAPSPVMEVTDERDTAFYIHTLAVENGELKLLKPERIVVKGERGARGAPAAA
jgi:Calcineurin-like phosphoesterase